MVRIPLIYDATHIYCKCPTGYYDKPGQAKCILCHYTCRLCLNGNFDGCTQCDIFLYRAITNKVGIQFECQC